MLVHQDEAPNLYTSIARVGGTSAVPQDYVDMELFPRFANVTWLHGELGPGDTLYIPHSYWHQVNSRDRNLGVNIWWQHREDFRWWDTDEWNKVGGGAPNWGTGRLPPFDEMKARLPEKPTRCTPVPPDKHMGQTKLVDEGRTK